MVLRKVIYFHSKREIRRIKEKREILKATCSSSSLVLVKEQKLFPAKRLGYGHHLFSGTQQNYPTRPPNFDLSVR